MNCTSILYGIKCTSSLTETQHKVSLDAHQNLELTRLLPTSTIPSPARRRQIHGQVSKHRCQCISMLPEFITSDFNSFSAMLCKETTSFTPSVRWMRTPHAPRRIFSYSAQKRSLGL
jgi:hypothetical protein